MRTLTFVAITVALALSGCGKDDDATNAPALAVGERLIVRERVVTDLKTVSATVSTRDMGEARTRIGGLLTRLSVKEGDLVRKGQVIAMVSDQRLSLEARAYRAQAAAAEAEAVRAAADYQRVKSLYDKGIYAAARLEQAEATAAAARETARAAREQAAAAAELIAQGAVLAPADGRVLHADTPLGSVVTPGQTIAVITAGEPVLRLEVPEARGASLRPGQSVVMEPGDLPGVAAGVIDRVYPAVDDGLVRADIKVDGLKADLIGRRVRVRLAMGERPALVIPRRFVVTRYGVDFVTVLGKDGKPVDVAVQLAPGSAGGEVEVLSGLIAGDVLLGPGAP